MHPIKDATDKHITINFNPEFQSMHPIKDATKRTKRASRGGIISIHAPYKGCNSTINRVSKK